MPFDNPSGPFVQDDDTETTKTLVRGYHRILNGWCKKALLNEHGEYCAVGALCLYDHEKPDYDHTWFRGLEIRYLCSALPKNRKPKFWNDALNRYGKIVGYNNDPMTTKDDILRLYERAIMLSRTNG